ncbi:hypothetical protein DEU56DRAFT_947967 [Suillus clintonianus]|uniref:uncharacterized protein n=1 Tax=Suillus clintonianus TaxID=1904413 RepID=UPI001B862A4C|nr:uncharacterized protein DEU56DRAFT_947967 [Suillus clintonianus]KAG2154733.1 hypothetical protein DEU56DRAFT_947967 [Suillus clintonianus]
MARAHPGSSIILCLLLCSSLFFQVSAQSTNLTTASGGTPSPTVSANLTTFLTTSSYTLTTVSHSGNIATTITTVLPTVYNATSTIHANTSTPTSSASPTPTPIVLATRITPAFGVLGAILIITGLPSAFWGHKNRWTSFFLIGFYTLSLVCFVLIVKFGILPAINPPNNTLQGMFVLASAVAGIMGGAFTIFFWKATKYFIGAWGGFAFGLWIQCFRNGGLITPVGMRWILYIACSVVAFVLCTIPRIHWHMLLVATAFVGSSAFILGVDCYTTAGLKEFYVWNLGFTTLFPKYVNNGIAFPVTQTMEIELGLIGAITLMGGAVQLRILRVLQRKLKEIAEEEKKRDEEAELNASGRFAELSKEQEEWERDHPSLGMHGRTASGYSGTPLMKDFPTRGSQEGRASMFTLVGGRGRYTSGVSEFMAASSPDEDSKRAARDSQAPGALPALDLGLGIQQDVPSGFITDNDPDSSDTKHSDVRKVGISSELEDLARKEELLAEIQTIRRSIDALRSDTPGLDSDDSRSRRISLTSRRTLSYDLDNAIAPRPHTRPPRQPDPRGRVQSMELSKLIDTPPLGASIGRPTSVPLRDDDWDSYVRDRKLLQPPAGVTAPIPTSRMSTTGSLSAQQRLPVPPAVTEALSQRKRRESLLDPGVGPDTSAKDTSDEDAPIATLATARAHTRKPKPYFNGMVPSVLTPSQPPAVAPPSQRYPPVIFTRNAPSSPEPERSNIPIVLPPTRPLKAAVVEPSSNIPVIIPRGQSAIIAAPVAKRPEPQRVATFEEMEERHREKMRGLQAPITEAEKQNAEVVAAKRRWERSNAAEREAVNRRQAEKAAELAREEKEKLRRKSEDGLGRTGEDDKNPERRPKGINADKLAAIGGVNNPSSSKRQSVLRVEDWQRHQQDAELGVRPERSTGAKRESRTMKTEANATVPFPGQSRPRDLAMDRRRSAGVPRDPPS